MAVRAQTRAARRDRELAAEAARRVQWGRWLALVSAWQAVSWSAALVIATLVGFSWILFGFFVIVFSVSCLGLFTGVLTRPGWLLERQVAAGDDVALAVGHLPPRLARLVEETRMLRLAIEAAQPEERTMDALVMAWVSGVRALGPLEKGVLEQLGLRYSDVLGVLLGEALEREQSEPPRVSRADDPEAARRQQALIAEHLEAFEVGLLRYDPDPYRGG